MRAYTVFTGTRVIITAENEADMQSKLAQGIWEEQEVDSVVEHVGPELEGDTFDPAELTDGELLDRVYDLIADDAIPQYQMIDLLRDLLNRARTN